MELRSFASARGVISQHCTYSARPRAQLLMRRTASIMHVNAQIGATSPYRPRKNASSGSGHLPVPKVDPVPPSERDRVHIPVGHRNLCRQHLAGYQVAAQVSIRHALRAPRILTLVAPVETALAAIS